MHALTGLRGLSGLVPLPSSDDPGGATLMDSFNRANNASSLGTADSGQAWQVHVGTWGITGNQAYCVADGGAFIDLATLPGSADGTLQVTLSDPAGASGGSAWVVFRCTDDAGKFLYLAASTSDHYRLWTYDEALTDNIGTGNADHALANDVVKVVLLGTSIQVYVNDVLDLSVTSAFQQTATRVGIGTDFGIDGAPRFDQFSFTP